MLITVSYINLFLLLAVSICHIVLSIAYHGQCPTSPFLSITLGITGIMGLVLSIIALIIHRYDAYDGSNKWNLLLTYILFVYLIGSRVVVSIMAWRLASRTPNEVHCATMLYWTSTLLTLVSYSIIIITCCLLAKLILLQRRYNHNHKVIDMKLHTTQF